MKSVDCGSNCAARRSRLLWSAPHSPLSVATRITARLRTSRASSNGWLNSRSWVVASRWKRYMSSTKGRPLRAASWALRIFDAAPICMALVICAVLPTERMRLRMSRVLCIGSFPGLFERLGRSFQFGCQRIVDRFFDGDFLEQLGLAQGQELRQFGLEFFGPVHRHIIHIALLYRPKHCHLDLDRDRAALRLLENLDDALTAIDQRLRLGIQFRTELGEGRKFPKLGEIPL